MKSNKHISGESKANVVWKSSCVHEKVFEAELESCCIILGIIHDWVTKAYRFFKKICRQCGNTGHI